jgi:hypothetical protein
MNLYERQQKFFEDLNQVCRANGITDAYVNSYLGVACQDHMDFVRNMEPIPAKEEVSKPWLCGSIGKINIWIDFSRKYSDHRLTDRNGNLYMDFKGKYGDGSLM